jgi:glycyl-tRNA synthetase
MLNKYNIKSPSNAENSLTMPFPFNLMFKTLIGPEGNSVGYLRPETAQGLFVNFRRLLDYNQGRMPFAAAQIGLGFRNEIAPRNGLLRVREFCMAEIEHFVNPSDKSHPKFKLVASKSLCLFPADNQLGSGRTVQITMGEAVGSGIVNNETLGYFMARTQMWLEKIGVDPTRMRFRQHLKTEMAHYAADCWDMEIKMSYGWIECVGHADRACYDLEQHSKRTGCGMHAAVRLPEPVIEDRVVCEPNKKLIGPRFKLDQKTVIAALEALEGDSALELQRAIAENGGKATVAGFEITSELVSFKSEKKTVVERKYTPSVIEPSYGVGRILYAVLEHSFSQRFGDEQRCVMSFKPCVAPIKVGVFALTKNAAFDGIISSIRDSMQAQNISSRVDSSSGTVGRRYARADELGIPFGITVDFGTLLDDCVTVRERDSMSQVRVPISGLVQLLQQLVAETLSFDTVMSRWPVVKLGGADEDEEEEGAAAEGSASTSASAPAASEQPVVLETTFRGKFSRPNPVRA